MSLRYGLLALATPILIQSCKEPPRKAPTKQLTATQAVHQDIALPAPPNESLKTAKTQWVEAPKKLQDMTLYIAEQRQLAAEQDKQLVVYVGATWCEPCQRFQDAVQAGALDTTFPNIRFLKFDADKHEQAIVRAGYASKYIPLFSIPNDKGEPQGRQFMGAIKGEGAVPYIVPKLQKLLQPHR
jgi:thiol-disulfide isomerase/thioredoxin